MRFDKCGLKSLGPPHGWTLRNFENITSIWGEIVCLETSMEDTISFLNKWRSSFTMEDFIDGHFIMHIGDVGYRILIKDASCTFHINPQFLVPARSSSMEDKVSNEDNRKIEMHGDDVASNEKMKSSHWPNADRVDDASLEWVIRETPRFESELENSEHVEKHWNSPSASINLSSNTKLATI